MRTTLKTTLKTILWGRLWSRGWDSIAVDVIVKSCNASGITNAKNSGKYNMNVKNEDWAGLRSSKTNAEGQPSDRHLGSASVDSDMEEGDKLIMTIAAMMPIAVTMPATVLRISVAVVWLMVAVATSLALTSTVMTVTLTDLDIFMLLALVAHFTTSTSRTRSPPVSLRSHESEDW